MASSNRTKVSDSLQDGDARVEITKPAHSSSRLFGYGRVRPQWLQTFNKGPFLLAALCLCAVCQSSIVNGFISTSISSLEKRFSLSSTESGVFSAFYDVAVVLVLIPLSHFGKSCRKGRVIATGMVLVGIGSFLLILPHFLAGNYTVGESISTTCKSDAPVASCSSDGSRESALWYYILLASQLFIGIGAAPLFTLGISFMDENVAQKNVAVYLGVYMAVSTIGPAIGFIAGGQLLKIWGDIGKTNYEDLNITGPTDPRWYGAWWIGFLVVGILSIWSAIPLYGFPRELPEKQANRAKDVKQTHKDLDKEYGKSLSDYPNIVLSLLKTPSMVALMAMQTTEAFLMNGFITFIPKVFENLFSYSPSYASTITGIIVVPMGLFGSLFGAAMAKKTRRFRPTIALAIAFNACTLVLSALFLHECEQLPFAGVSVDYNGVKIESASLTASCNSDCSCDSSYNPVCNVERGVSYYSPCFAGCAMQKGFDDEEWESCACTAIFPLMGSSRNSTTDNHVVKGLCRGECSQKFFLFLFACLCFFAFSSAIPIQNASLRVVSFDTRDVAIGITWLFMRVLGSIPGAVIFGAAIDRTCVLWKEECGEAQSCLRYDSRGLSHSMLAFAIGLKSTVICLLAISSYFYRPSFDAAAIADEGASGALGELKEKNSEKSPEAIAMNTERWNG